MLLSDESKDWTDEPRRYGLVSRVSMGQGNNERSIRAFPVSRVGTSIADATAAILAKNRQLVTKNRNYDLSLVSLTGNESARIIEETFIDNYLRVVGSAHCQGAVSLIKILNHAVGWKTGFEICAKIDMFVTQLAQRILLAAIDAYVEHIRPEDAAFDCAKIILSQTTKTRTCLNMAVSHSVEIIGNMLGGGILSQILKFAGDFLLNSASMIVTITTSPTCDHMLSEGVPEAAYPFSNIAVETLRGMSVRSIEAKKASTQASANAGPRSTGTRRPTATRHVPVDEPTFEPAPHIDTPMPTVEKPVLASTAKRNDDDPFSDM